MTLAYMDDHRTGTLTNSITQWSRVPLHKLIVIQKVKKFPAFYGTRWFITVFTRTRKTRDLKNRITSSNVDKL
jgi:hypothetical protein